MQGLNIDSLVHENGKMQDFHHNENMVRKCCFFLNLKKKKSFFFLENKILFRSKCTYK